MTDLRPTMTRTLSTVLLSCLAFSIVALPAAAEWFDDPAPRKGIPWRHKAGKLGAMLILTEDEKAFIEEWQNPKDRDKGPNVQIAETARIGDTVTAFVVFSGCDPMEDMRCRTLVDFRLVGPNGEMHAIHDEAPLWRREPAPPDEMLMGEARVRTKFGPDDPLGVYTMKVRVRDIGSKTTVILWREITLEPALDQTPVPAPAN